MAARTSPTDRAGDPSRERELRVAAVRRLIGLGRLDTATAAELLAELATTERPAEVDIAARAGLDADTVAQAGAAVLAELDTAGESPWRQSPGQPSQATAPASWIPTAVGRYEVLGAPRPFEGGFVLPARDPSAAEAMAITVLATTNQTHRRLERAARAAVDAGEPSFAPIREVQTDAICHEPLPPALRTDSGPARHLVLITRAADHEPNSQLGERLGDWLARPAAGEATATKRGLRQSAGAPSPARRILDALLLVVMVTLALAALYALLLT